MQRTLVSIYMADTVAALEHEAIKH
jgi:hypothetical protein